MHPHRVNFLRTTSLILLLAITWTPVHAADTGSSNNFFYLKKLDDNLQFINRASIATRDGFDDFFFGYLDLNLRWKTAEKWYFEVGYRQAWLELADGWRQEYRPMFNLGYRGKLGEWGFSNRNRLELRYFEGEARNRVRYRNETILTAPRKWGSTTPYISQELFYNLTNTEFNENWLTTGVSGKFSNGKGWKLGYRLQSRKFAGEWNHRHVLVTGISILDFK